MREQGRYQPFSEAFARQVAILNSISDEGSSSTQIGRQDSLAELSSGQELQQYRVLRELGQGGMGIVYMAEDQALFRKVVLKLCRPQLGYSPTGRQRALQEARTTAALRHPGIAGVYELLEYHGLPVMVMEWVDGQTLADYLTQHGPVPWRLLCRWMVQACKALDYAHQQGLIHRDIKPSNLMITKEAKVKLTDFGLAKWQIEKDFSRQLTASGGILGTVNYMSPEQARADAVDGRSDLFSLGVLCFEALTGKLPFLPARPPACRSVTLTSRHPIGRFGTAFSSGHHRLARFRSVGQRPRSERPPPSEPPTHR